MVAAVAVAAHLALTPAQAGVGRSVTARAVVSVDPKVVDPGSVRVSLSVAPLAALGAVQRSGLRFTVNAACLDEACVPDTKPRTVRLAPLRVTGRFRNGHAFARSFRWPALVLVPQVPARALRGAPPLRLETKAPPPDYAVSPRALATVLDVAAALLALAALAVVRSSRRRRAELNIDPLDRALALVRASAERPPDDRRRALNLLARVLDRRGPALTQAVDELAWSRPAPSAGAAEELADDIEQAVVPR